MISGNPELLKMTKAALKDGKISGEEFDRIKARSYNIKSKKIKRDIEMLPVQTIGPES